MEKKTAAEAAGTATATIPNDADMRIVSSAPVVSFLHKKNMARRVLKEKGIMKRDGHNSFDNYSYFSEAQYKRLFTEIFAGVGLEFSVEEDSIEEIQGTEKQRFGRRVRLAIMLADIDTGFSEVTHSTGEGFDKGDKAIYKAKTGALKYWLADNWMVATGDDPETESPEGKEGPDPNDQLAQATVELMSARRALSDAGQDPHAAEIVKWIAGRTGVKDQDPGKLTLAQMAKVTKAYEFLAKNAAKKAAEKPLDVNSKEDTFPAAA